MSLVKDFHFTIVKKDNVVSVVSEVKQGSERNETVHLNIVKVKQCSERSQRFPINSSEEMERGERSQ